jgi:putative ABC transport system permease protein
MMHGASALLEAGVIGPMRHQLGRTLLAIVAIALGIALGLSIYLVNRAAADEISLAARSLYGLADLAVVAANEDFDESLFPRIARSRGVSIASPKLEVRAKLAERNGAITVIGVDAFRYRGLQPAFARAVNGEDGLSGTLFDSNTTLLSAAAARELRLEQGDELRVQVGLGSSLSRSRACCPRKRSESRPL